MYLKELTINGFKSFARKGELEFSAAIAAIVGPNGSGKSNVAESFRFVLGEQSVKAMRGKKGEDLIWGGSEKVARGNRASVEVVFDNTKRTFPLDFDEVRLERVVHRDGQNEYKLNGTAVRLKDIHELLASANIGATGHHIISQGEADRVLAAGPKERREMIEDALGLKVYQLKKQEAERKLEKTVENIAQVESLRREAAPHLRYLKKQVERAERALEVQAQLKHTYADYLKREDLYIAFHHDRLLRERRTPAETLEDVERRLGDVRELLEKKADDSLGQEVTEAESAYRSATAARQTAEQIVSKLDGQVSFLERRLSRSEQTPEPEPLLVRADLERLVTELEQDIEQVVSSADVSQLEQMLRTVVHTLHDFLKKKPVLHAQDTSRADEDELHQLRRDIDAAMKEVEHAREKEAEAEAALNQAREQKEAASHQNHEAERDMFTLREQQREIEMTIRNIDRELAVLERDREEFKRELQEAVALTGRAASDYYAIDIVDEQGTVVSQESLVNEDREAQITRRRELEKLKIRLEELGVGNTEELLKEYKEAEERDAFLAKELADLDESVKNLQTLIAEMQEKLEEQFVAGIEKISVEFNRFFTLMFGGGSASLTRVAVQKRTEGDEEIADDEPVVQEGVELSVSLPNKRVKGLNMLSGGERALTSIAVIFAMSQVNPPPFIILDETDAALDEANSRRYGDMIEELAKKSQLVLITHNRETMSRAGILYGITMGSDGVSKVLSVKFDEAAAVAK